MSNIIQFPSKINHDWISFSNSLVEVLTKEGVSDKFQKIILQRMEVVFEEFEFSFNLTISLPEEYAGQVSEEVMQITKLLQKRTSTLLLSRLSLEIELAKCQGYS